MYGRVACGVVIWSIPFIFLYKKKKRRKIEGKRGRGWGGTRYHELSNNRKISYVLEKEEINTKRRFSRQNSDSGSTER